MTTKLTESTEIFQSPDGNHKRDGQEVLTVTLWAEDEKIMSFGGYLGQDDAEIRAKAAKMANQWDETTGDEIRAYDSFIREIN